MHDTRNPSKRGLASGIVLLVAVVFAAACSAPSATPATPSGDRIRITGSVMDDNTSKAIDGVCVSGGKPGDCTWKTDVQGHLQIDGLVPAEWHFFFEHSDYMVKEVVLKFTKRGETQNVDVRLTPKKERS